MLKESNIQKYIFVSLYMGGYFYKLAAVKHFIRKAEKKKPSILCMVRIMSSNILQLYSLKYIQKN